MHRVVLGGFGLLLGLLVVLACGFGLGRTVAMAELVDGTAADPAIWSSHWRGVLSTYLVLGVVTSVGGTLILRRVAWGAVLIAIAALLAAAIPVTSELLGIASFEFEKPSLAESVLLVALAAYMAVMYVNRGRWSGETTPNTSFERTREG
jgi:hypothetical protein